MTHYAHTLPPPHGEADWEPLSEHLERVADLASGFASEFGCPEWGRLAGLWHDLGKYSDEFQRYLRAENDCHQQDVIGRVDHSSAGAQHARRQGPFGQILAYCIAGHHAGLPNDEDGAAGLSMRLRKCVPAWSAAPPGLLTQPSPTAPKLASRGNPRAASFAVGFFTRMVFSALVDADFLATESFMSPDRAAGRARGVAGLAELAKQLDAHLNELQERAADTLVNQWRRWVLDACRRKAMLAPGFFSLNVPTGGGKTLSSLAFGLTHGVAHGFQRIIYAIPFTSIIEQTADVFRRALGDMADGVLEHHSNIDPDDPSKVSSLSRLAAANFDASLIVTTNVQLFESLFASRTSRCRKLHRLARSVIILDEAQTLPPQLLAPTLAALDELVRNYGATVVLCSATQPAVEKREGFPPGLEDVRPIIEQPGELHAALRRTRVELVPRLTDDQLATDLAGERQVLCIVNSRQYAKDVFSRLGEADAYHLSANMCPAHRSVIVQKIRSRLGIAEPCRVVSTQVIEAGVDVDFPVVYRAVSGLDSIAQAAGRCNREGRLTDEQGQPRPGRVVVFEYDESEHPSPPFVRSAAGHFREVAGDHAEDLLSPSAIEAYFRLHYWQQGGEDGSGWDRGQGNLSVLECFGGRNGDPLHHQFRDAADRYKLIDENQTGVIVPYGRGAELIRELERMADPPDPSRLRTFDRAAQRYAVGVRERDLLQLLKAGVVQERHGRHYVAFASAYNDTTGLQITMIGLNPEDSVI